MLMSVHLAVLFFLTLLTFPQSSTNVVTPTKRLWAFAHFGSRLVQAGAYRVGATISGGNATTSLNTTAFANADGSIAVQVCTRSGIESFLSNVSIR